MARLSEGDKFLGESLIALGIAILGGAIVAASTVEIAAYPIFRVTIALISGVLLLIYGTYRRYYKHKGRTFFEFLKHE